MQSSSLTLRRRRENEQLGCMKHRTANDCLSHGMWSGHTVMRATWGFPFHGGKVEDTCPIGEMLHER